MGLLLKGNGKPKKLRELLNRGNKSKLKLKLEKTTVFYSVFYSPCILVRVLHIVYTLRPIPEVPGHHQGLICTYEPSLIQKGAQRETFPGFPFQTNKEAKWSPRVS